MAVKSQAQTMKEISWRRKNKDTNLNDRSRGQQTSNVVALEL